MASERVQRQIERLLDEAEVAVSRLEWGVVRDRAQAVLAFDPENPDGLAFLAAAERAQENSPPPSTQPLAVPQAGRSEPTSFANGRYQVQRFLGEGGKKKVYLAQDTTLDREVAFALIKTEGLDDTSRTRIQREAQAMGRLGSHPHIVTVFDLGQEGDQPYMVTELMGGGDVEGLIAKAADHLLSLEQAIGIAGETCQGLEFAHGRGIVHRDLKPGNVWLTESGTAKIGDFGLAVALDRSRLTTEGMMVGTVSYMPPEQAMGGEVTPRSDLYSLGAMLYEMVTGRPPFLGDDSVAIIGQHINTPPVAPTWHNSDCPRALDALILRLLAKDPSERPESASDVLAALEAVDLDVEVGAQGPNGIGAPQHGEEHSLDSLAGGVFVGRQREMGDLKGCLEDALSGRGRLVTLVGEPGIGKTRTAQELATYAGLRGAQVLWGRSYEEQGVPPYWPWVQAIRSYVRERDPEQLRSEMGAGAADIAEVVSDVRERLRDLQPAPQLDPEQARFRLFDSIAAFLKTASQRQPLVLVLDDLHWADQPSLLLLQFVARELGGARLLLIGTYRDMELSRQHPLAEALGELTRERLFQRVLLHGLTQDNVGRFIEMAAGVTPPSALVTSVFTQTEGNPLFVTEVVRLLVQEGELSAEKTKESDSWTIRIPEGVREVIGRRLNRLSQRCNDALTVASVIGREFTLVQLTPLVEEATEDRLLEVLEEALAARVIEELPQAVGHYQFTHALIQETLAGELSTTRRVRLHAHIAEKLEELYGEEAESHAAELTNHFAEAEAVLGTEKLVHYSLIAGEKALESYAYEEALRYFQLVVDAGAGNSKESEMAIALFGLGRAQVAALPREQLGVAVGNLRRAFEYFVESRDIPRVVAIAEVQFSSGPHLDGWVQIISRALELVSPESHTAAILLCNYGRILGDHEGDSDGAMRAFDQALPLAQSYGDSSLEFRILANAARIDAYYLRWQDCLEKNLRAIELVGQDNEPGVNDLRSEVSSRLFTSYALFSSGNHEAARPHVIALLDAAERLRNLPLLLNALGASQMLANLEGDWPAARAFSDRALETAPEDLAAACGRALLDYQVGEFAQGEARLEHMVKLARPQSSHFPVFIAAVSLIALTTGVTDLLENVQATARASLSSLSRSPNQALILRAGLAVAAAMRGDIVQAKEQYAYLENYRSTLIIYCLLNVDRLLGLLSQTMGELDKSTEHFEDALAFCRKAGYRPELAWTCCDYADTLKERDGEGDRAKAMSLLDESLATSSDLGMRPLMERVLSRREILGA
ncbi:MAG: hypothetical protein BZY88_12020 [SAR202 cluster bacterium Io17-Chloro-G9]|nr:MAG: hypothetical protein BZY88_12020 [SAR202 cluster bacterium Io17-Chloro-G9]